MLISELVLMLLNDVKNAPSYEFICDVILKNYVV